MRLHRLTAIAFVAIVMCPATMADTVKSPDASGGNACRSFVQSFYKWYLSKPQFERALKDKAMAFSPELLKELKEDYAASQKNKDEVVGLDFDPFLNTNAEPHARYVASKVTKKDDNYLVQVDGSGGNRTDHTRIVPEVAYKNGKCQYVNFHYSDCKPPDDNLLSVLKTLRNERAKK